MTAVAGGNPGIPDFRISHWLAMSGKNVRRIRARARTKTRSLCSPGSSGRERTGTLGGRPGSLVIVAAVGCIAVTVTSASTAVRSGFGLGHARPAVKRRARPAATSAPAVISPAGGGAGGCRGRRERSPVSRRAARAPRRVAHAHGPARARAHPHDDRRGLPRAGRRLLPRLEAARTSGARTTWRSSSARTYRDDRVRPT